MLQGLFDIVGEPAGGPATSSLAQVDVQNLRGQLGPTSTSRTKCISVHDTVIQAAQVLEVKICMTHMKLRMAVQSSRAGMFREELHPSTCPVPAGFSLSAFEVNRLQVSRPPDILF